MMAAPSYLLRLYVSGATPHSVAAIKNITTICDTYIKDNYQLDIIDIYQNPEEAKIAQIVALPTLIKYQPIPTQRFIGDMSNTAVILKGLGLA